jgi:phosphopantothenate---cysteine ligase (ATP)
LNGYSDVVPKLHAIHPPFHPTLRCSLTRHGLRRQLETDPNILIPKARGALERYGHQLVIGNELHTRKYKVVFVERRKEISTSAAESNTSALSNTLATQGTAMEHSGSEERYQEEWIRIGEDEDVEIESLIVEQLIERHKRWIEAAGADRK